MGVSPPYSNDQHSAAAAIPVYVVSTTSPFTTDPAGMAQLDLSDGAVHDMPAAPAPPQFETIYNAVIQAVGQDVTWSNDGVDPSATHGFLLAKGTTYTTTTGETMSLKFIVLGTATGAKLNINWQAIPIPS